MSTKKDEQLAAPKPVLDVFWAANCSKNQQTLIPNTHPPAGWRILCLDPGWLAIPVGAAQRRQRRRCPLTTFTATQRNDVRAMMKM